MHKTVGAHLRLESTLSHLIAMADQLEVPFFQCFLVYQVTGKYVRLHAQDVAYFLKQHDRYSTLFLHASYWINLAAKRQRCWPVLKKELNIAERLGFTHFVMHPGVATGCRNNHEGVELLAKGINIINRSYPDITVVLENVAHGNRSIGGDLRELQTVLELLDYPDRVAFCLDTAHAHAYGYDIMDTKSILQFVDLVDQTIGLHKLQLVHLNDTNERRGSKIDKHEAIGEGMLGEHVLKQILLEPRLRTIPTLMELPPLEIEQQHTLIQKIAQWRTGGDRE